MSLIAQVLCAFVGLVLLFASGSLLLVPTGVKKTIATVYRFKLKHKPISMVFSTFLLSRASNYYLFVYHYVRSTQDNW